MTDETKTFFRPNDYMSLQSRQIIPRFTPKELEKWLHEEGQIMGQDAAVKTAALIVHRHFQQRVASVNLFCGPTGSGKTQIWRALQQEFSERNIVIHDASTLTAEGWKGNNKISTIFKAMKPERREHCILVLDEFDKCLEPQYSSSGSNYSDLLQNQLLTLFDHGKLFFGSESEEGGGMTVNTRHVTIVLLGAFSRLMEAKAADQKSIGFGAQQAAAVTYANTEITEKDLLAYTCLREELAGRIDRIVCLKPLSVDQYCRILCNHIEKLQYNLCIPISIAPKVILGIAEEAVHGKLGARWAIHRMDAILDEMVYETPYADHFVYAYKDGRGVSCSEDLFLPDDEIPFE